MKYECPVCSSLIVESKSDNEVFGRCFCCGYSWTYTIEELGLEKIYEKSLNI